jgi:pyridinium-3,5-bisthiocarboxylic acid mononucleotide nickel chelatase
MALALIDCPTGLAGNMLLAALFDLGVPPSLLDQPMAALGLTGAYRLLLEERRSGGLRGLHLDVEVLEPEPGLRHWSRLRPQLEQAPLAPALRQRVVRVFSLLAEAEAVVHGVPAGEVHFHELGAIDALVDVVGVCAGLLHLGVERLVCTPPPAGHGSVHTAHGVLPVPVPAVLELARRQRIPLAAAAELPAAELTTPTGLALAACWVDHFGAHPGHVPLQVGVGLGTRQLDRPNLLRLVLAEALPGAAPSAHHAPRRECVVVQQAQIDDATPEDVAVLLDVLRQAGALDVFSQPLSMKKGRSGWLVTALVLPGELQQRLRALWWQHSTTLGVRERLEERWVLPRRLVRLETPLGTVRLKQARLPDGRWRSKPEHDDLQALARSHGLSLDQVRASVRSLIDQQHPPGPGP